MSDKPVNGKIIAFSSAFGGGASEAEIEELKSAIAGQPDIKTPSQSAADLYVCDEDGNVIAEFKNGHIKTKNFDSSNSPTDGIMNRNKDVLDGIYAACKYNQPASSKQFCILLGGDIHGQSTQMASMIELLNSVDAFDAGIMLGDIASTNWTSSIDFYTTAIANATKPFLTVIGNHDAGYASSGTPSSPDNGYTNISDLCAKFITPTIQYADLASGEYTSGNTYYYKDFSAKKIRLIVLNQYEYPADTNDGAFVYTRGYNCYSQAQITWLCNTLASVPSDYGVIIALHSSPAKMICDRTSEWVCATQSSAQYGPDDLMDHETDGWIIADIVNAWINGTSLSKTYGYTPSGTWTSVTVSVDYTSRGAGEFITYIGGHWHKTLISNVYGHTDQMCFNVDTASPIHAGNGDVPRKTGTKSEDCVCALAVDRANKSVKLFYIGAHYTTEAINRQYGKYAYGVTT